MRQHEREGFDDVRREVQQDLALGQRLGNKTKFVVLEIAQAAVNELGARRRRVRSEVVALDQQHGKAAARGVARDARAIDAAADDQKVAGLLVAHRKIASLPDAVRSSFRPRQEDLP